VPRRRAGVREMRSAVCGTLPVPDGPKTPILPLVRRGILGGTFDPPHLAHLVAGEAAFHQMGLDVVTFMPAGSPWQKAGREVTAARHRWEMTRLAIDGVSYFEADEREIVRDGWTYTVDTLAEFPDDEIVLVLGADAAAGLDSWHKAEEVVTRAVIAVMPRPGVDRDRVDAGVGDVRWLDAPELEVSGTGLRAIRARGGSIRFLVPGPVYEYIERHSLYL
jgi:nicotinate-nucleotide adenylyltransferase